MTPLRERMIEELHLRGYAACTVQVYVRAVAQLARFQGRSPDQLSEEQVREDLLHLTMVRKAGRGTLTVAPCGIKFFCEQTLGRPWHVLDITRPKRQKKLPAVLGREEVWRILSRVRQPVYRVCLTPRTRAGFASWKAHACRCSTSMVAARCCSRCEASEQRELAPERRYVHAGLSLFR